MLDQVKLFLIALQFYTRIPVTGRLAQWSDYSAERLSISTRYFTLIGILIGAITATIFWLAHLYLPASIAVVLAISGGVLVTGGFHEDGWADFCDGFGGHTSRERTLEIMTDSRIGTYAGLGLVLLLLLKIVTLSSMAPTQIAAALLVMHPVSRAFAVLIMATLPYAKPHDESKAKPIATNIAVVNLVFAIAIALIYAGLIAAKLAPSLLDTRHLFIASCLMSLGWWRLRSMMKARLQGYTGDTLGATQQLTEGLGYIGLAII
jgi:adenosylcobinamide-GDP ribazoletransferase